MPSLANPSQQANRFTYSPGQAAASRTRGFSLLEMLIVVAILGMLAGIAIPTYKQYQRQAVRQDAINILFAAAQEQERWYAANGQYMHNTSSLDRVDTSHASYTFNMTSTAASNYDNFTVSVTAKGDQVDDVNCQYMAYNHLGAKTARNGSGSDTTSTCWGS